MNGGSGHKEKVEEGAQNQKEREEMSCRKAALERVAAPCNGVGAIVVGDQFKRTGFMTRARR